VNAVSAHLHALDGRLRIKVAGVKGSPPKAREIEDRLQMCDGITQATANPTTGSILILYDSHQINQERVLHTLRSLGCLPENGRVRTSAKSAAETQPAFGQELVQTVVRSTMEFALQRLVHALI
jgi:copper chaperone CopZ